MAETSNRVSSLAARYTHMNSIELKRLAAESPASLARDIRSLAASALRQDETPGLRARLKRILSRG